MIYTIYKHTTPNDKVYIGITTKKNLKERFRNGNGYRKNNYFYKAIIKYGWENIKHEVLYEDLTDEEAKLKEIELIAYYKSANRKHGYNLSTGGEGATGYKHTQEQIEKQKQNRKGFKYTDKQKEARAKLSKEIWLRDGYKEKMSEIHKKSYENGRIPNNKGKHPSKETINKIKKTRKVKYIYCIETNKTYRGTRLCAEELNIDRRSLMKCLKGLKPRNMVKGYHFKYVEDINEK